MDQPWFELTDIITTKRAEGVWVPLHSQSTMRTEGGEGQIGRVEEFIGVVTLAVPKKYMAQALKMDWSSIWGREFGPLLEGARYTPTGVKLRSYGGPCGVSLVLIQRISGEEYSLWHLDQDLVFALGLKREGNTWVRPSEDYREAVRLQVAPDGRPLLIEIRQEFLKDYLCARGMGLCLLSYQERSEIQQTPMATNWPSNPYERTLVDGRWLGNISAIDAMGMPVGSVAVFHITRPDANPQEDVPSVSHTDQMKSESHTFTRDTAAYRVSGEVWRTEWLDPGSASYRVRGDPEPPVDYLIDAAGSRESSVNLATSGRWIWFRPEVVPALVNRRGGELRWHTREMGEISCSPGYGVTFGLNSIGLLTVYAKDIAYLPEWQQRIWAGFNVSPEGGLSSEMHRAQVVGEPSDTNAPEKMLAKAISWAEQSFQLRTGTNLFLEHEQRPQLLRGISRFSGCDWSGLLRLAKDVTRLTADSLNKEVLRSLVEKPGDLGSLKLLEKYLSTIIPEAQAKMMMAPLFCVYDLRLADAHLPKSNYEQRLADMGVKTDKPYVWQSAQMLNLCANAVGQIGNVFRDIPIPS